MSNLEKLTKAELKELAEEKEIEVKSSATKAEIVAALEEKPKVDPNIIMSGSANLPPKSPAPPEVKPKQKVEAEKTVKVFAERGLHQVGWGRLRKGVNEVSEKVAEYWLKHPKVKRVD